MGAMVTISAFGASRLSHRVGASFTAATHLPWMLAAACGAACAIVALGCTWRRGLAASTPVHADDTPVAPPVQAAPARFSGGLFEPAEPGLRLAPGVADLSDQAD
jgi:hypothetical protein